MGTPCFTLGVMDAGGPAAVRDASASLWGHKLANKHGFESRAQGEEGRASQACRDT